MGADLKIEYGVPINVLVKRRYDMFPCVLTIHNGPDKLNRYSYHLSWNNEYAAWCWTCGKIWCEHFGTELYTHRSQSFYDELDVKFYSENGKLIEFANEGLNS